MRSSLRSTLFALCMAWLAATAARAAPATNVFVAFALAGVGSFAVTDDSHVFSRPDCGSVGFGVQGLVHCCDIIRIANAAFGGYDRDTAIGPAAGLRTA